MAIVHTGYSWVTYNADTVGVADEVELAGGRYLIVGRNEQVLEYSINGTQWDNVHTFPAGAAEEKPIALPAKTFVRVIGSSVWALGRYNEMSG